MSISVNCQSQWKVRKWEREKERERDVINIFFKDADEDIEGGVATATIMDKNIRLNNEVLNILTLPVGQGDSTIIKCPKSNIFIIIDMGSSKGAGFVDLKGTQNLLKGEEYSTQVLNFIKDNNGQIKEIFLTHPHRDHLSFMAAFTQKMRVFE